ncbi:MAG: transglutaminase-like domain-containing protein, partial [Candidatus Saccharimonadales bacterium]|nr:transglutaminase-like domain-containing protein [Candidatus Saccharimonadales bacterium]
VHRAVADEAQNDTFSAVDLAARDHGLKYSDQLVGELRSRGIPARLVLGKVWSNGSRLLESPLNHAWAEAFAPGLGWMTLDPLMSSNTDYFGTTNVTHIGLVLWGIADNRPPINLDTVNVRYTDKEFSTMGDQYEVSAKKYIVLPGISVLSISVQTPPGSIQDNTAVRTGSDSAVIPLGSLAPLQTARTRTLRMGGGAFNSESIEFGTLNGENLNVTATTDTQLSYLLVFYELGAILLLAVIVGVVKLRRRRLSRRKTSHDSVLMHEEAEGDNIEDQNLVAATDTLMEDEQPSDTLPEVVDPAGLAPEDSPQNAPLPEEAGPKDGTIKQSNARSDDQPKPPYRHLIQ